MENFGLGDRWPLPLLSPNRSHSPKTNLSFKSAGSDAVMLIQLFLSGLAIRPGLLGSAVQELKTISNSFQSPPLYSTRLSIIPQAVTYLSFHHTPTLPRAS